MPRIAFTPNLRRHLDCPTQDAPGTTLRAALDAVFAGNPRLRAYLLDEHGRLRKHVTIFINDRPSADRTTLSDALAPADEVFVFQALSGG
ncbi:MoaD/ThiS family protein [Roseomonas sp. AR75]|uniref:MoaD/ThiS family protein n=1 Tax=Roseomonas sp. AR75 TaxID=2562311 RepID=UPI0010C06DF8|nr:MoaD/ThiS family protein [Roseomonas sp. AR75]